MENAELDVEKLTRDVGMPLFFLKTKFGSLIQKTVKTTPLKISQRESIYIL